ncbi:MAG: hypothetical protein H7Z38_20195 [Rubrivivax sp.]|nr:hypothetical protein [Pyrinomonadaceae bacterium]
MSAALDRRIVLSDEILFELLNAETADASVQADLFERFAQIAELKRMATEVEFMESSFGWRLIRRVRVVRESLFPHGTRRKRLLLRIEAALR